MSDHQASPKPCLCCDELTVVKAERDDLEQRRLAYANQVALATSATRCAPFASLTFEREQRAIHYDAWVHERAQASMHAARTTAYVQRAETLAAENARLKQENKALRAVLGGRLEPLCPDHGVVQPGHRCRDFDGMPWQVEQIDDLLALALAANPQAAPAETGVGH